jgi:hypothetical protein
VDEKQFDALVRSLEANATRRRGLHLLAGSLLAAVIVQRASGPVRAMQDRPDRDGDGLFDDDETDVYGTNPDVFDTDGDGVGDGEEIYNRDNGLPGPTDPLTPAGGTTNPPPPALTCAPLGGACAQYSDCCLVVDYLLCCPTADGGGVCTDVAANGSFLCPDPGVPTAGCPAGQTDCGGFCTDLTIDHGNCGVCGNACPYGANCSGGTCANYCATGLTDCGGTCADFLNDPYNCGSCGVNCGYGGLCCDGVCQDTLNDPNHCGGCNQACFNPLIERAICVNGVCDSTLF